MAALTPQDILDISKPIEEIYNRTVDELLVNIAKHMKGGAKGTVEWEIQKLAEMGALTEESVKIIAKNTGKTTLEVREAFYEAADKAVLDIDPQLKEAQQMGVLPGTVLNSASGEIVPVRSSPAMQEMVQAYTDQAVDKLNLTNTTMLASTQQAYQQAVQSVVNDETFAEANRILSTQALEAATAQETRTRAIRKAMDKLSEAGLTGFYDKAGRSWSPEAYASMVVRTTAHNTAIQAVKTRQQEYGGGDIFQVSTHPGARPLCYPYQGKFFSWSSGPGEFTDGGGHKHTYQNISESSYGQAAGLFGVNCGHHPIPMIPGFSFPQDGPEQSEEENAKEYAESQIQRQYERDIRKAKRDLDMATATGDEEAVKAARAKVREEQAKMRGFIEDTGRARRYDRERIPGGTRATGQARPKKPDGNRPGPMPTGPADSQLVSVLHSKWARIDRVDTKRLDHFPTSEEIVGRLGGGDLTDGSCSSLAFAYIGNKSGTDVLDFRGGRSCDFFSRNSNIYSVLDFPGVIGKIEENYSDYSGSKKLFATMEEGKEYYFATGRHAAIVRKRGEKVQYLELQMSDEKNRADYYNGWHDLDWYGGMDKTMKWRFKAQKSRTSYGMKYKAKSVLIDAESLYESPDFQEMLNYINTPESEQQKGAKGHAK